MRKIPIGVLVLLFASVSRCTSQDGLVLSDDGYYSTCPDLQHSLTRSVLYKEVAEPKLLKWAKMKPYPKVSTRPQVLHVRVQVEGERVFCAQALDGPTDKQKTAVESAMHWRFKKHRGDFNDYLIGTLTFRF